MTCIQPWPQKLIACCGTDSKICSQRALAIVMESFCLEIRFSTPRATLERIWTMLQAISHVFLFFFFFFFFPMVAKVDDFVVSDPDVGMGRE